jgi:type VI secretion system protein ImpM
MSTNTDTIGLFGKLPAHGDFIQRNLSSSFINVWDEWLQHFIAGTKEQLGESWLDIYLTSPLWRFAFSAGVIDENVWAGVMIPSVDRVGRYYPFTIVRQLPQNINPFEYVQLQTAWFKEIEMLALSALDEEISIDELISELESRKVSHQSDYSRAAFNSDSDSFEFDMSFEEQSITTVYPLLLDSIMTRTYQSYSVWQTSGSDCINPCLFSTPGLPGVQKMPAMLNGDWQGYNWQQPYIINDFEKYREEA